MVSCANTSVLTTARRHYVTAYGADLADAFGITPAEAFTILRETIQWHAPDAPGRMTGTARLREAVRRFAEAARCDAYYVRRVLLAIGFHRAADDDETDW